MHPKQLLIDDFSYVLPPERIAFHPLAERDASLLLHYRKGIISTHSFLDLPELLPAQSRILFNNTFSNYAMKTPRYEQLRDQNK
ncbi:MAG: S-adenosylmethionine:tRNA ribosyltransferase-isomerase, partial [Chitinophagaceae bacterium]